MYKILNSSFARKLIEFISIILSYINKYIPKSNKRILLFSSKEVYLNNYAMYKYLIENNYNKRFKIYYSMPGLKETAGPPPENVYFVEGLLKTALLYITTPICFLDIGSIRIKPSDQQEVFNLWHGTPLKRIGFMSKTADKSLPKNMLNSYSHMLVSSENFIETYMKSFNLNQRQIFISGQPRLDSFFGNKNALEKLKITKGNYKKVIMWMTTYRVSKDARLKHTSNINWSETNLPIIKNMEDIKKLNNYLKKIDVMLIIKIHQGSAFSEDSINSMSNVLVIRDRDYILKDIQLYEILAECDALITDYSSVYFDYLLLNRPIGFILDDIDDYNEQNGFVFENPLDYMPGHHIYEYSGLLSFIDDLIQEKDNYAYNRTEIKNYANRYVDDLNCKRILDFVIKKIVV